MKCIKKPEYYKCILDCYQFNPTDLYEYLPEWVKEIIDNKTFFNNNGMYYIKDPFGFNMDVPIGDYLVKCDGHVDIYKSRYFNDIFKLMED